jgi:hypothetical protein
MSEAFAFGSASWSAVRSAAMPASSGSAIVAQWALGIYRIWVYSERYIAKYSRTTAGSYAAKYSRTDLGGWSGAQLQGTRCIAKVLPYIPKIFVQ